ncbi:histone-like nucleoid-structuring protein Lsr2 [Tessaracoccus antarcticus]|uniref:Lsr2 family protein n=1 Tax=Tessaracoccus antarcticus TaxID=2479848 RepID=A0A3M0GA62_9ACTN|nr:Lsr2 family protein [Tessaracoccus antarcticus]RMB61157.1 Lsr2 family protein [Tessaracoccus antarcticus]
MARKVQMILLDDIDGSEAKRTVTFAVDGKGYEIDLNEANLDKLSEALAPFVDKARRTTGAPRRTAARRTGSGGTDASAVRTWAREQGHEVSDRGRVPKEIRDAYEQAH